MDKKHFLSALTVFAIFTSPSALAGPIWEFETASQSFSNGSWNFANNFRVLSEVTVTGLGYYADPTTGSVDDNHVALYDSTGNLLAQATVTNAYDLFGHFRYVTVADLTLQPGDYQVAGVSQGDNYTWNNIGFYTDPSIQYLGNTWEQDNNGFADFLGFAQNDVSDGYWGPNVFIGQPTFTGSVFEPASIALIGLGLAGLGMSRRKAKA